MAHAIDMLGEILKHRGILPRGFKYKGWEEEGCSGYSDT
jgi:hypothetical protein